MTISLTQAEISILFRQDPGTENDGGYQGLLVGLQRKVNRGTGSLDLTPDELEKIPRYAFEYGQGGWENRLVGIFGRTLGPRLGR